MQGNFIQSIVDLCNVVLLEIRHARNYIVYFIIHIIKTKENMNTTGSCSVNFVNFVQENYISNTS